MNHRVAIVTGGGQGIGRAFCLGLATRGYRVVIAELDTTSAAAVEAEVGAAGGIGRAMPTDITDPAAVNELAAQTLAAFGRIDILVNNARWSGLAPTPIDEVTDADWAKALQVNVTGAFNCTRAVVPAMKRAKWGRIVNMSSATVLLPPPRPYAHYVTTKAALLGFTRALAVELGSFNITVNAILPASVETGVERPGQPVRVDRDARAIQQQAIKRREVPGDMVGALAFLVSDEAEFITGQGLNVDGGYAFS
jgi:3-oxoacyl-[acyl-carrier protein] reductase